jgi:ankyrin repeat protein
MRRRSLLAVQLVQLASSAAWADDSSATTALDSELPRKLTRAIADHDLDEVARLLAAGVSATAELDGMSPLSRAVLVEDPKIAAYLLDHGAAANCTEDRCPLREATESRAHGELVPILLDRDGAQGERGQQALLDGILTKKLPFAMSKYLDVTGANGRRLVEWMPDLLTPEDHNRAVKELIERGLPLVPPGHPSLLERYARAGNLDLVEYLVKRGAPLEAGRTPPLLAALREVQLEVAGYLLDQGATTRSTAELLDATERWCPTRRQVEFALTRLGQSLHDGFGANMLRNAIACHSSVETFAWLADQGAELSTLHQHTELLYDLEKKCPQHASWLAEHGVSLSAEERQGVESKRAAEAEEVRRDASRREQEQERAEQRWDRAHRARAREDYFRAHQGDLAWLGFSLAYAELAIGLREAPYRQGAPAWMGYGQGAMAVVPGAMAGVLIGGILGKAYGGPGASSSVFA